MNATSRSLSIGLAAAVLLGAGFYFLVLPRISSPESQNLTVASKPSLDRPYTITADLPENAKSALRTEVKKLTDMLRENSQNYDAWLDLAVDYKIAGDFKGAGDIWEYLSVAGPSTMHYVALGNLGDLYMNFIKDYLKAEQYYIRAIALKPDVISYYADMYRLYHYLYKVGTGADAKILAQGLEANPGNKDLLELQNELKTGK